MSEIPDFSDRDAAEAWFKTQPREVRIAVAARSSLRVLPAVLGEFAPKLATKDILIWRLACFRATLVSAAAAVCSAAETERVEQLRAAATSAAAFSAAFSAARAATSHDAKTAAASIGPAFRSALWPDISDVPELVAAWHSFRDADPSDPVWDFWLRWYQGMWDGKPLDWELTTQVALIPYDVWEKGAKEVAEAIREIEAAFWADALPQAEQLVRDVDGLYDIQPLPLEDRGLLDQILKQLGFALSVATESNSCSYDPMCTSCKYIRYTLDECRDDPNSAEQNMEIARDIIQRKLDSDQYKADDELIALLSSLDRHVVQLRADHPDVRDAWEKRLTQKFREVGADVRLAFARAIREWMPRTKGRLHIELDLDAETIEQDSGREAQAKAAARASGRAAKATMLGKVSKTVRDVEDSTGYKGARMGTTGWAIVDMIKTILGG